MSIIKSRSKQTININERAYQLTEYEIKLIIRAQSRWRMFIKRKKFKKMLINKKRKYFTAFQLLSTQEAYFEQLKFIIKEIMQPSKKLLDQQTFSTIFCNMPNILALHQKFLVPLAFTMKQYNHHLTKLSQPILKNLIGSSEFKDVYTQYCVNFQKADQIAKITLQNNQLFSKLLKKKGLSQSAMNLQSHLIKPIQRMCKYKLLLQAYIKNTEVDHIDYNNMNLAAQLTEKLVNQTNNNVQQFLFREKLREVENQYALFFKNYPNSTRKILTTTEDIIMIDLIKQEEIKIKQAIIFNDGIFLAGDQVLLIKPFVVRPLPNLKYFKNMLQIIDKRFYYTLVFNKHSIKEKFLQKIIDNFPKNQQFITSIILGTQPRQSLFKTYTVYIVRIQKPGNGEVIVIYPRFKQLLKVQDMLKTKGIATNAPYLHKQNPLATLKSKTIEKRKLLIQQFLQRIMNLKQSDTVLKEIEQMLQISLSQSTKKQYKNNEKPQLVIIKVFLPNNDYVSVKVDKKYGKVKDLKKQVINSIGLLHGKQFAIFKIRNKINQLLHEQQSLSKIVQDEDNILSSLNPFKEQYRFLFTRHYYLSNEEQYNLFKEDFVRTQLQLSVIRSQILNYRLDQQLMLTFLCLFALYINLPTNNDNRISTFLKQITQNQYKIHLSQFKVYLHQVQKMVSLEEDQTITLPFIIIKIMHNSQLYQCIQFYDIKVSAKNFKETTKYIPGIQENMILGVKKNEIIFMKHSNKQIIETYVYNNLQLLQVHPAALVFDIQGIPFSIRLKTSHAFNIETLFNKYKKKDKENRF